MFGVLATGFSVLLGFIIFLSFSSYDESRSGAETEATIVTQQVETAQFLPTGHRVASSPGELMCYSRSVVGPEWDALADGTLDDAINPWGAEMYLTLKAVEPQTAAEQSAYDRWMDQTTERQQARVDRIHGAEGIIPLPLWLALFTISGVIFVYMLFFADSGERAKTQALLMGSVSRRDLACCSCCWCSSTIRTVTASVVSSRPRWNARCGSWTPRSRSPTSTWRCPVTSAATRPENEERRAPAPHEVLITVLLIVGAVAASWSSYQATRWNGEQAKAAGRTSALRVEASAAANLASAQTQVDVATFIAWTDADGGGDTELEEFYVERFRPEFKTAFDAWLATDPFVDASAPKTPFAMEEYVVRVRGGGGAARRRGRGLQRRRGAEHPAVEQLRPDRGALHDRAALRGHGGQDEQPAPARRGRRGFVRLALVALAWVSTFPVSVAV